MHAVNLKHLTQSEYLMCALRFKKLKGNYLIECANTQNCFKSLFLKKKKKNRHIKFKPKKQTNKKRFTLKQDFVQHGVCIIQGREMINTIEFTRFWTVCKSFRSQRSTSDSKTKLFFFFFPSLHSVRLFVCKTQGNLQQYLILEDHRTEMA